VYSPYYYVPGRGASSCIYTRPRQGNEINSVATFSFQSSSSELVCVLCVLCAQPLLLPLAVVSVGVLVKLVAYLYRESRDQQCRHFHSTVAAAFKYQQTVLEQFGCLFSISHASICIPCHKKQTSSLDSKLRCKQEALYGLSFPYRMN
jgi:hypothetical protein